MVVEEEEEEKEENTIESIVFERERARTALAGRRVLAERGKRIRPTIVCSRARTYGNCGENVGVRARALER